MEWDNSSNFDNVLIGMNCWLEIFGNFNNEHFQNYAQTQPQWSTIPFSSSLTLRGLSTANLYHYKC